MTRVVAVSNRVAEPVQGKSSGGLAVGVLAALAKTGGMWFGWNGKLGSGIYSEPEITEHGRITYATFGLNRAKFDEYVEPASVSDTDQALLRCVMGEPSSAAPL